MTYRFEREARTAHSEAYLIHDGSDNEVGRVDLHFTTSVCYATLNVPDTMSEDDVQDLIAQIDDRLVMTADPYREDFVVTVWAGREFGVYSDEDTDDDEDDDDELDVDDFDAESRRN